MALQSTGQGADQIQSGSESQRPTITSPGQIRFNTNTQDLELYEGGRWVPMRPPVQDPIKDTSRTIGLKYNRGLELSNGDLQTALGTGLNFDSNGNIQLTPDEGIVLAYEPIIESITGVGAYTLKTRGGPVSSTFPGKHTISFNPPKDSNAGLMIASCKIIVRPNPDPGSYPSTDLTTCGARGEWKAAISGRNAYAISAASQLRLGTNFGRTLSFYPRPDGSGSTGDTTQPFQSEDWFLKIEELRWDKGQSGNINFNLEWNANRTTSEIYYGPARFSLSPFQI